MKAKYRIHSNALVMILLLGLNINELSAQVIFREDKPMLQALWHRMADYSPTLRSVESAEISPDGRYVISASKFGNYLMLWHVPDGKLLWEKVLEAEIEAVTFSPDGKYIVAGDEAYMITVFDLDGKTIIKLEHTSGFDGITWSPNGKYIGGGSEKGEVVLYNTSSWDKEMVLDAGETVNSLRFTKDSKYLIAAGNKMNPNPTHDWDRHGFVKAWDVEKNWSVIFEINAQEKSSKSVRFHPDEKSFAVGGFANQVKVFSFPEAKELAAFDLPKKIEAVEFHPEGNFLFVGGHTENLHIFNTDTYEEVEAYPCRRIEYIHFSPDGRLMVTGHEDSGLLSLYLVWSKVKSGEEYHKLSNEILKNRDLK